MNVRLFVVLLICGFVVDDHFMSIHLYQEKKGAHQY